MVKSVHLEQNVLARDKTFLPGTKYSCLQHTTSTATVHVYKTTAGLSHCQLALPQLRGGGGRYDAWGQSVHCVNKVAISALNPIPSPSINLKGQCHEMNHFYEGLKNQIITFCVSAHGF